MSNIISFNGTELSDTDSLIMSNGGTDVFINVLALSGSALAQAESEKRLAVYLSEKDQSAVGRGCVGFDIAEMPWNKSTFENDKKFMIGVINGARNKIGWEKLDYSPNTIIVLQYLDIFESLINKMTAEEIKEDFLIKWLSEASMTDPVNRGFPRCKRHNTFLTCFGCQICNS
ncbi:MAG TPA: hypothetical protein DDX91_02045 [Ruminococcaceae bacterium]|nr:hypothetical protein [Oscillospiraceae bacterium]